MRSPTPLAVAFLLGLAVAARLPPPSAMLAWAALACLALALGIALARSPARTPTAAVRLGAVLALGALGAGLAHGRAPRAPPRVPPAGVARLTAFVEETRHEHDGGVRARVRVLGGERLQDGAVVARDTQLWVRPFPLPCHATVRLVGRLAPRVPFRNDSPHDALPPQTPYGTLTLASADSATTIAQSPWARLLDGARVHVRRRLQASLDRETGDVARALVLGDPDSLDDEAQATVRASGLSHVFAVSGMHVTLLAGLLMQALCVALGFVPALVARCPARRAAAALGIPLALGIAAFTGGSASGWRASITTAIAWAVVALGRRPAALAVTSAAALVFAAADPESALRPAFLLSIAATAAILTADGRPAETLRDVLREAAVLSVRTAVATAPIVLWTFGSVPVVSVLANVLLVPVGSLLLLLAGAHAVVACGAPWLVPLTAAPLSVTSRAFMHGCAMLADIAPRFLWPVPTTAQGYVLGLLSCALLLARHGRARVVLAAGGLVLLAALELALRAQEHPRGELRVSFLDVGQGDAALIDLPDGELMLIDAGGSAFGGPDPGERVLLPLLRARRRDHVDIAVLSHPHPDHYGGLPALLAALPVRELWDSGQAEAERDLETTSQAATRLLSHARRAGTRVLQPAALCGKPRWYGGARVEVLWPCPSHDAAHDPNDNSLVVRLDYRARSLLFAGDVEAAAERALVRSGAKLRADVLKVPHHGSRTSSSAAFLARVSPRLAVLSAGAHNGYGHPHADVVARLSAAAPTVIDLGRLGGATLSTDGHALSLRTFRAQPRTLLTE